MRITPLISFLILLFSIPKTTAQQKNYVIHTAAFYNFENLFDTINDPQTNDDEWTPKGTQHWTSQKYQQKLQNLAQVLAEIGSAENPDSPTFIGGCEIENRSVLEDLVKQTKLINKEYGIIHFDSPDKRGIDVALLYRKKQFQPTNYSNIPLYVYRKENKIKENTKTEYDEKTDDTDTEGYEKTAFFKFEDALKNVVSLPEYTAWKETIMRNLIKEGIPTELLENGNAKQIAHQLAYLKGLRAKFMQKNKSRVKNKKSWDFNYRFRFLASSPRCHRARLGLLWF